MGKFININWRRKILIFSIVLSFIFTLLIRFTLYVEDCNLLVLTGTFIIIFLVIYSFNRLMFRFLSYKGK